MANPVLNENVFRKENVAFGSTGVMTVGGTATKTLLLLLMVVAGAAYTWKLYYNAVNPQSIAPWMWGGLIGAFIMAMIISVRPKSAQFLAPIYAAGEGLALGGVSAIGIYYFLFRKDAHFNEVLSLIKKRGKSK